MDSDITSRLPRRNNRPAVGDVRLVREIGRGGMGVVYAGWHDGLDAPCAVKFLLNPDAATGDRLARFQREARICAELDEPALVRVFDSGRVGGLPYFVMEWVPGHGLDVVAGAVGRLTESEVMTVLRDVGQALFGLHKRGIIHRDVKPSNLLLRAADGRLKIADLGLAKQAGSSDAVRTQAILGTPAYMSPEQVRDSANVGPASDFFALGTTAYSLLTGRLPFEADSAFDTMRRVCETQLPRPTAADGMTVSDALWHAIERLTEKDPAARIHTAAKLMEVLPGVSAPFRPAVLDAARPAFHVLPPDDLDPTPGRTVLPATAVGSLQMTVEFSAASRHRDALLFCQCLQNDFLAPPTRPDWEPPNRLHVGRDEALRVVGADPKTGPLVRAVAACAEADHVRVMHIRDWHDAADPRQRAELDFFGDHCLMGTWGARFIDAIEAYSRDRRRAAVIDAGGINDLHDTPILGMIDALAAAGPGPDWRAETPVGVVGVWTDVKVQYLLYDLKTRAGLNNLATCSALVASPNRAAQDAALGHLAAVFGVNVFAEVDEFLRFLGVEPPA